jgi:hypothetical protein
MADLTTERMVDFETWRNKQLTLKSGEKAVKGCAAIGDPATGKMWGGGSHSTGLFLGHFAETVDASSTGTNADTETNVDFLDELKIVWLDNDGSITIANRFAKSYLVDNHQVALTDGGGTRPLAGTIMAVDSVLGVGVAVGRPFLDNT